LERNKERLRRVLITEVGCPITVTGSQIESPIEEVKHWAEHGRAFEYLVDNGLHETPLGTARRKIHYEPVGVVGAITPWNVPFYLNIAETVPALMAGNTVVLKPAQLTPWSGSEYGRIVAEETDIPAGVFNVVVSNANEVGAALSADPRVDMITFTGSTATGRAILAAGAPTVKKTLLELGGKSAHIVLNDADFNSALPMAAMMACCRARVASCPAESCCRAAAMTKDWPSSRAPWKVSRSATRGHPAICRGRRSARRSGRRCSD
jgi:aldehyde dehydrogenase (NAD+)